MMQKPHIPFLSQRYDSNWIIRKIHGIDCDEYNRTMAADLSIEKLEGELHHRLASAFVKVLQELFERFRPHYSAQMTRRRRIFDALAGRIPDEVFERARIKMLAAKKDLKKRRVEKLKSIAIDDEDVAKEGDLGAQLLGEAFDIWDKISIRDRKFVWAKADKLLEYCEEWATYEKGGEI